MRIHNEQKHEMIHDLGNKREVVHEIFKMKPFKVICEPLVLTLAYVGMIGPLATPYTLHPGPKGDEVRRCRSPKYLVTNLVTNLSPNLVRTLVNHQIW